MGEVWLADQKQPVRRRVAIKLIKVESMGHAQEVVVRFESERQAWRAPSDIQKPSPKSSKPDPLPKAARTLSWNTSPVFQSQPIATNTS